MKKILKEYGFTILLAIIVIILISILSPLRMLVQNKFVSFIDSLSNTTGAEFTITRRVGKDDKDDDIKDGECEKVLDLEGTVGQFKDTISLSEMIDNEYRITFELTEHVYDMMEHQMNSTYLGFVVISDDYYSTRLRFLTQDYYSGAYYYGVEYDEIYGGNDERFLTIRIINGRDSKNPQLINWFKENALHIDGTLEKNICKKTTEIKTTIKDLTNTRGIFKNDIKLTDNIINDPKSNNRVAKLNFSGKLRSDGLESMYPNSQDKYTCENYDEIIFYTDNTVAYGGTWEQEHYRVGAHYNGSGRFGSASYENYQRIGITGGEDAKNPEVIEGFEKNAIIDTVMDVNYPIGLDVKFHYEYGPMNSGEQTEHIDADVGMKGKEGFEDERYNDRASGSVGMIQVYRDGEDVYIKSTYTEKRQLIANINDYVANDKIDFGDYIY